MRWKGAAERVHRTFGQWKRKQIPDRTAFYHTALEIRYRRGGLPERLALIHLRYRRSKWRHATVQAVQRLLRRSLVIRPRRRQT